MVYMYMYVPIVMLGWEDFKKKDLPTKTKKDKSRICCFHYESQNRFCSIRSLLRKASIVVEMRLSWLWVSSQSRHSSLHRVRKFQELITIECDLWNLNSINHELIIGKKSKQVLSLKKKRKQNKTLSSETTQLKKKCLKYFRD